MQEIHANQVVFDNKKTLPEVLASILAEIKSLKVADTEETEVTTTAEENS